MSSLGAWEQQALETIRDELAGSDPELATLLTTFTRLPAGEDMPVRESRTEPRSAGRPRQYLLQGAGLVLGLLVAVALVAGLLVTTLGVTGLELHARGSTGSISRHLRHFLTHLR